MKVYVLWHVYKLSDDIGEHDEEKLVGIYSTEKKARDIRRKGITHYENFSIID